MMSPVTSTSVATKGAELVAGSKPRRRIRNGSMLPGKRSEHDDADETGATVTAISTIVRPVVGEVHVLPKHYAQKANAAEHRSKQQSCRQSPGE